MGNRLATPQQCVRNNAPPPPPLVQVDAATAVEKQGSLQSPVMVGQNCSSDIPYIDDENFFLEESRWYCCSGDMLWSLLLPEGRTAAGSHLAECESSEISGSQESINGKSPTPNQSSPMIGHKFRLIGLCCGTRDPRQSGMRGYG